LAPASPSQSRSSAAKADSAAASAAALMSSSLPEEDASSPKLPKEFFTCVTCASMVARAWVWRVLEKKAKLDLSFLRVSCFLKRVYLT
jgi:hypothetical protein